MKVIKEIDNLQLNNTAIAIGKFDGIHRGHRLIMEELIISKSNGLLAVIFTFSKSPKSIVENKKIEYILTEEEKYRLYEKIGIDIVIEYPMSKKLINMERDSFLDEVLINKLGMKKIICGSDFRFGHNRLGDIAYLKDKSNEYGYELQVFDKLKADKRDISSTFVKELILEGEIEKANELLGYPYTIIGKVVHGNEVGRTINFPTANIIPDDEKLLPPNGVYFTTVNISNKEYKCVTNIGSKPTITDEQFINVETNIFDFNDDLYDAIIEVKFYKYHRKEIKFDNLTALKNQISYDANECKDFFKNKLKQEWRSSHE